MLISPLVNPYKAIVGTRYPIQQNPILKNTFNFPTIIQNHFHTYLWKPQHSFDHHKSDLLDFKPKTTYPHKLIQKAVGGLIVQQHSKTTKSAEKAQAISLNLKKERNNLNRFPLKTIQNFTLMLDDDTYEIKSTDPKADLYSIKGYETLIDEVIEYVLYLQDPNKYVEDGIKAPKGFILSGPPGVGKTILAQAIAGHAEVPLFVINAGEVPRLYVGEPEQYLKKVFTNASKCTPCVVFIDEIESVGAKRISTNLNAVNAQNHNNCVNQLLTLLSAENKGMVVIGATNNFDLLEPALIRPGRFDKHLVMSLPTRTERQKILTYYLTNKSFNVNVENLATISAGFSGAQIERWVNAAALNAKKMKSSIIDNKHFDLARTTMLFGVVQADDLNPIQKIRTATHEAGHALVGHLLNLELHKASVIKRGNHQGYVEWIPNHELVNSTKEDLLNEICMSLAGIAAEKLSGSIITGRKSDLKTARELALKIMSEGMGSTLLGSQQELNSILEMQLLRAMKLLEGNKQAWERVKEALIENGELLREDFLKVIAGEKPQIKSKWKSWWSHNHTASTKTQPPFAIPPKKGSVAKSEICTIPAKNDALQSIEKEIETPKFSIMEVAKALGIDGNRIRNIQYVFGEYNITFKFYFENPVIYEISELLKKNDIENSCYLHSQVISIKKNSINNFEKFVKKNKYNDFSSFKN